MTEVSRETILAAIDGDEDAFTLIVEAFQTPVYNLCYRMLYNEGEAEEAAQESFWKAWNNLSRYDPARSFSTWLLSIAAHHCIDQTRKRRLTMTEIDETMEEAIPEDKPLPEHEMIQKEEAERLKKILMELNEQDRAVIILRYYHDLSDKEIGENLGLTESAVKSRLFRARKQIAEIWKECGDSV